MTDLATKAGQDSSADASDGDATSPATESAEQTATPAEAEQGEQIEQAEQHDPTDHDKPADQSALDETGEPTETVDAGNGEPDAADDAVSDAEPLADPATDSPVDDNAAADDSATEAADSDSSDSAEDTTELDESPDTTTDAEAEADECEANDAEVEEPEEAEEPEADAAEEAAAEPDDVEPESDESSAADLDTESESAEETLAATAIVDSAPTTVDSVPVTDTGAGVDAPADTEALPAAQTDSAPTSGDSSVTATQWAPTTEKRRSRKALWWTLAAAGVLIAGTAAASLILIAPGTTVAGVPVGGMTVGMATEKIDTRLAQLEIDLGPTAETVVNGEQLGADVDARALVEQAYADYPLWKVGSWSPAPITGHVNIDTEVAEKNLRQAVPQAYSDPIGAVVEFDASKKVYALTPAISGTGIDLEALENTLTEALADGQTTVTFDEDPVPVEAAITDDKAQETVDTLNGMLTTIGFYIGDERTVAVAPADAAEWLDVVDDNGELQIEANEAAIQKAVDGLAKAVDRKPQNAEVITNSAGETLRTITEGISGRSLGDVTGVAAEFADMLESGTARYELPVSETKFTTTTLQRTIDVNLATQMVTAIENGKAIDSWAVSSGVDEFATQTGTYTINWKLDSQNMGDKDLKKPPYYYQPDVKWVMYFNGDEAFHGVYWHSNWGTPMSHGCVGMPEWRAEWLYNWSPEGVEVTIHY